jgi:hypothetical protein
VAILVPIDQYLQGIPLFYFFSESVSINQGLTLLVHKHLGRLDSFVMIWRYHMVRLVKIKTRGRMFIPQQY